MGQASRTQSGDCTALHGHPSAPLGIVPLGCLWQARAAAALTPAYLMTDASRSKPRSHRSARTAQAPPKRAASTCSAGRGARRVRCAADAAPAGRARQEARKRRPAPTPDRQLEAANLCQVWARVYTTSETRCERCPAPTHLEVLQVFAVCQPELELLVYRLKRHLLRDARQQQRAKQAPTAQGHAEAATRFGSTGGRPQPAFCRAPRAQGSQDQQPHAALSPLPPVVLGCVRLALRHALGPAGDVAHRHLQVLEREAFLLRTRGARAGRRARHTLLLDTEPAPERLLLPAGR